MQGMNSWQNITSSGMRIFSPWESMWPSTAKQASSRAFLDLAKMKEWRGKQALPSYLSLHSDEDVLTWWTSHGELGWGRRRQTWGWGHQEPPRGAFPLPVCRCWGDTPMLTEALAPTCLRHIGSPGNPPGCPPACLGPVSLDPYYQPTEKKVIWIFSVESLKDAKFRVYFYSREKLGYFILKYSDTATC